MSISQPILNTNGKDERLKRLMALSLRRNEARKANHAELVEEDRRSKLPANWEARQRRLKWEEEEEAFREECAAKGIETERARALNISADVADRLDLKRSKRQANQDQGFSSYSDASHRKYLKQIRQLNIDRVAYQKQKERLGELAFPTANTIGLIESHKDDPKVVERFSQEVTEAAEKRPSYSRRRPFDADADIDYINERNKRFNELLERHYGKYTSEIKQNLERGTAI